MNHKKQLINHLVIELESIYRIALNAAKMAHKTATDKENIAENKYDTMGIEAAYLAQGQAKRASECCTDLEAVRNLPTIDYSSNDAITLGTLVSVIDQDEQQLFLFLAPEAGGLKFVFEERNIVVVTPSSPLGKKLLGKFVYDEFDLDSGKHKKTYRINEVF